MILDTPEFRAMSARVLLAIIGILYVAIGLSLTPPYPLLGVVDPEFWKVIFTIAGVATMAVSTYSHPAPRWLRNVSFLLVMFAAGSRLIVLATSYRWDPPVYAWGIIVAWQLRDWLDICRWR